MKDYEKRFLEAYYKAMETGNANDWIDALISAKHLYNYTRTEEDRQQEAIIQKTAKQLYRK